MKTILNPSIQSIAALAILTCTAHPQTSLADTSWWGDISSNWSTPGNWSSGLPSSAGGNDIINPGSPFVSPVVSTAGNTTSGQTYVGVGAGLDIQSGGQLLTSDFITGIWGNSLAVNVEGTLTLTGILNMGAGGYLGTVNIDGGSVTSSSLSINTTASTVLDISGAGRFTTSSSQLGNIDYWVANNDILADNGAATIKVDTTSDPGSVILTVSAVPEPSSFGLAVAGLAAVLGFRRKAGK